MNENSWMLGVAGWLLVFYLGTAPVYWLPGMSVPVVRLIKLALIAATVALIYFVAIRTGRFTVPGGAPGWLGVIVLLATALPGFLQTDLSMAGSRLLDVLYGFVFLWAVYNFVVMGGDGWKVFERAAVVIVVLSGLVFASSVLGAFNWPSSFGGRRTLANSGFGGLRTGWSNGVALYLPVVLGFSAHLVRANRKAMWLVALVMVVGTVAIVGAQFGVGGRTGLLASVLVVFLFGLFVRPKVTLVLTVSLVILFVAASDTVLPYLNKELRVTRAFRATDFYEFVDIVSSRRLSGYTAAAGLIAKRPLQGYGFGTVDLRDYGISYEDVHNQWMFAWLEAGLFFAVALAWFVVSSIREAVRQVRFQFRDPEVGGQRIISLSLGLIIVAGVIMSMLEPAVLIGAFQNSAVWWAAIGVLWARERTHTSPALEAEAGSGPHDGDGNRSEGLVG